MRKVIGLALATVLFSGQCLAQDQEVEGNVPELTNAEKKSEKFFKDGVSSVMPMSNDQVLRFRKIVREHAQAIVSRGVEVRRNNRTVRLSSAKFQEIYISPGYVTTINFADSLGNAWPLSLALPSNEKVLAIAKVDNYTILATAVAMAGDANLVVKLKGQKTPIHLTVKVEEDQVDYMLTARHEGISPEAEVSTASFSQSSIPAIKVDSVILESFLSQTPPADAVELKVDRVNFRAWRHNGKMFIRSPYTLATPNASENGIASDGNGYYIYRFNKVFRKPMFLIDGEFFFVSITDA